jgi:hypothetical protein
VIIVVSRKAIGILIIIVIGLVVVMFGDAIVPTLTSTPVQFDLSNPTPPPEPRGNTGRLCAIYSNDSGC